MAKWRYRRSSYMNELPKIFASPFGLTPKIPTRRLRITTNGKIKDYAPLERLTSVMRNSLLRENYANEEFSATQILFARSARSPSLRSGRATGGYAVRFVSLAHPSSSLRSQLRISASRPLYSIPPSRRLKRKGFKKQI